MDLEIKCWSETEWEGQGRGHWYGAPEEAEEWASWAKEGAEGTFQGDPEVCRVRCSVPFIEAYFGREVGCMQFSMVLKAQPEKADTKIV